jgi:uncharacterized membrane protein
MIQWKPKKNVPEQPLTDQLLDAFNPANMARDLILVAAWIVAAILFVYVPVLNQSFMRVVFALPMVLFIPGYVLVAALFPGKDDLDGIERLALSFGLSIAVVPLIGFVLNYTPWGIRLDPIVVSLVIFTSAMLVIAQYRRSVLSVEQRFAVPFWAMVKSTRSELFEPGQSRTDRTLSVILIIAIIAAIGTTIHVIVVPKEGEKFTEFYVIGPGTKAADYPTRFPVGEPQSLTIGIGNHEYRNVTYTVETILVDMIFDTSTNTSTLKSYQPLDSFTVTLSHNETRDFPYIFTVDNQQYNGLQFLLFNETVPSRDLSGQDRINASYRDLHLWITVRPKVVIP